MRRAAYPRLRPKAVPAAQMSAGSRTERGACACSRSPPPSGRLAPPHGNRMVVARGAPILTFIGMFRRRFCGAQFLKDAIPILQNLHDLVRTRSLQARHYPLHRSPDSETCCKSAELSGLRTPNRNELIPLRSPARTRAPYWRSAIDRLVLARSRAEETAGRFYSPNQSAVIAPRCPSGASAARRVSSSGGSACVKA